MQILNEPLMSTGKVTARVKARDIFQYASRPFYISGHKFPYAAQRGVLRKAFSPKIGSCRSRQPARDQTRMSQKKKETGVPAPSAFTRINETLNER